MTLFFEILTQITLPIVALMALGWATQPYFKFDVGTLTRLQVYVVLPCFLLHFLSSAELPLADVWPTAWFTVLTFVLIGVLGALAAAAFRLQRSMWLVVGLAATFPNSGNFGIPVAQLAFPPDFLLHQAVLVGLQTVLFTIVVVWSFAPKHGGLAGQLLDLVRSPLILAVTAGLLLKGFEIGLPTVLAEPLRLMGFAYAPLALFTLGTQLYGTAAKVETGTLSLIVVLKLVAAPAFTWGLAHALGFAGDLTELLVVAAAAPVAVLLAIFCVEHGRHGQTASAAVLVSTILSPLVVTGWLLLARLA